ncbi:hypothetical protein, partial [Roseomonas sp. 18066]|uniref:hypothetical protein n=1 Tax=Roseomonas sp. 18066 TaxID=2681412 RepID=UPI001359E810
PSAPARSQLDRSMRDLAQLGEGLTVEDFRPRRVAQAARTRRIIQAIVIVSSLVFLAMALGVLLVNHAAVPAGPNAGRPVTGTYLMWGALWSVALGGLGAVASIFLHMLKLVPQATLRGSDLFEVIGRIILGCLFSLVLAVTIAAQDMIAFFSDLASAQPQGKSGPIMLLPFLAGYSIQLVLGLLEKAIRALQLTLDLDDRRDPPAPPRRKATRRP